MIAANIYKQRPNSNPRSKEGNWIVGYGLKHSIYLQHVGAGRAPADWRRSISAHAALQTGGDHVESPGTDEPVCYVGSGPFLAKLCAQVGTTEQKNSR